MIVGNVSTTHIGAPHGHAFMQELNIEKQLEKIDATWRQLELSFSQYQDTDVWQMQADDAITEALEADNLTLQNMSGGKYVQVRRSTPCRAWCLPDNISHNFWHCVHSSWAHLRCELQSAQRAAQDATHRVIQTIAPADGCAHAGVVPEQLASGNGCNALS